VLPHSLRFMSARSRLLVTSTPGKNSAAEPVRFERAKQTAPHWRNEVTLRSVEHLI